MQQNTQLSTQGQIPESLVEFKDTASTLLRSGMLPTKFAGKPEAVVITMLYGKELGLTPMQAVKEIHVINNVPSISANLMLTLVRQRLPEFELVVMDASSKVNRVKHRRRKADEWQVSEYTIEEARDAQLLGKDVWKKHAPDMLFARNVSRICRWNYSDVLAGFTHTPEEMEATLVKAVTATVASDKPEPVEAAPAGDQVNDDAVLDFVAAILELQTEKEIEDAHNNFAEKHKNSPATVGAAFDAYNNRLDRLRRAKAQQ